MLVKINILCLLMLLSCGSSTQKGNNSDQSQKTIYGRFVNIEPDTVFVGETAILILERTQPFALPKMRGIYGEYDENFQLAQGTEEVAFEKTDSLATLVMVMESSGRKVIRGFMEEYQIENDSIEKYLRQKFEISIVVLDTVAAKINTSSSPSMK